MEHITDQQWDELNKLTGLLTAEELIDYVGDLLEEREIAYVIWDVRDFTAEIAANWDIPLADRIEVAKRAYVAARAELSDTRNVEVMSKEIDGAWHDIQNTRRAQTRYLLRFRSPKVRNHVERKYAYGADGTEALENYLQTHPIYRGWNLVSLSEG